MRSIRSIAILAAFAAAFLAARHGRAAEPQQAKLIELLKSAQAPVERPSPANSWQFTATRMPCPPWRCCAPTGNFRPGPRIALEAIPGPAADEALRGARAKCKVGCCWG